MTEKPEEKALAARIAALSAEHTRLQMAGKLAEGPATLQRLTKDQMYCEGLLTGVSTLGINLRACNSLVLTMRGLSPGLNGYGIDVFAKSVASQPGVLAIPGSPFTEENKPGAFSRLAAWALGKKAEDKA